MPSHPFWEGDCDDFEPNPGHTLQQSSGPHNDDRTAAGAFVDSQKCFSYLKIVVQWVFDGDITNINQLYPIWVNG